MSEPGDQYSVPAAGQVGFCCAPTFPFLPAQWLPSSNDQITQRATSPPPSSSMKPSDWEMEPSQQLCDQAVCKTHFHKVPRITQGSAGLVHLTFVSLQRARLETSRNVMAPPPLRERLSSGHCAAVAVSMNGTALYRAAQMLCMMFVILLTAVLVRIKC